MQPRKMRVQQLSRTRQSGKGNDNDGDDKVLTAQEAERDEREIQCNIRGVNHENK